MVLIVLSYLIQWLVPRGKSKATARRRYLRWDIAPLVAFFGVILLALSFAQAVASNAIVPWGGGAVFGLVLSGGAWTMGLFRQNQLTGKRLGLLQTIRRYGPPIIGGAIALYLAVRVFGVVLEVFAAGTFGVCAIVFAMALFAGNKPIVEEKNER
ncbi:MAG TPA: hypothetical protein VF480_10740 [Verrucomicrobiae bacterium]